MGTTQPVREWDAVVRRSMLSYQSSILGSEIATSLKIDRDPPYPKDASLGGTIAFLLGIYDFADSDIDRLMLGTASQELLVAVFWLVKLEWNSKFKFPWHLLSEELTGKPKLKKTAEPYGKWLQSVLHLCEKVVTFGEVADLKFPSSAALWLREVIEELACVGGLDCMLPLMYRHSGGTPTTTKEVESQLKAIRLRIKAKEPPDRCMGELGRLIAASTLIAERSEPFNKGVFKQFHTATYQYILSRKGSEYATQLVEYDSKGQVLSWHMRLAHGEIKKLNARTLAHQPFQ